MMNHHDRQLVSPNFTIPFAFKTVPVCATVIIIMSLGDPDIIDGLVNLLNALADYLKNLS